MASSRLRTFVHDTLATASISVYVLAIYLSLLLLPAALATLHFAGLSNPWAWLPMLLFLYITLVPLPEKNGPFGQWFSSFTMQYSRDYFSTQLVCADPEAFKSDRGYVVAFEPHSALPLAMPVAFSTNSTLLPKEIRARCHCLASSICFSVPLVRHLYWWLGGRPVTRDWMEKLLKNKKIAVLCPGGVQEVLYMEHGAEVVYLSARTGFVRLAMRHGAPLVPVFAFGQTPTYTWLRPGPPFVSDAFVHRISRLCGAVPILILGRYGTPVPHRHRMTVVIGKPIEVPQLENPPPELVQQYLDRFIADLKALYDEHKDKYGGGEELILR